MTTIFCSSFLVRLGEASVIPQMMQDMEQRLKQELKTSLEETGQKIEAKVALHATKPVAMHSTTYEQYLELIAPRKTSIESILRATFCKLPPIPEHATVPAFPDPSKSENDVIIPAFLKILTEALGPSAKYQVLDTHVSGYLDGSSPDLTLVKKGHRATGFHALLTFEVQRGDIDNAHRGKALKYCHTMLLENPDRMHAMCVLLNTKDVELCMVERRGDQTVASHGHAVLLDGPGWTRVLQLLAADEESLGYTAPEFTFANAKYEPVRFLGAGKGTKVYEVKAVNKYAQGQHGETAKVVKVYGDPKKPRYDRELAALEAIKKAHIPGLPLLVTCSSPHGTLLMRTVAKPVAPGQLTRPLLISLLNCVEHVNGTLEMVHCDLEPKHVAVSEDGELQVLDFDSAAKLPQKQEKQKRREKEKQPGKLPYSGTLIFASETVLDMLLNDTEYQPHWRQDLVAVVKTVYVLLHPTVEEAVRDLAAKVTMELSADAPDRREPLVRAITRIRAFWDYQLPSDTESGEAWHALLTLAEAKNPQQSYQETMKALRKKLAMFVPAATRHPSKWEHVA